MGKLYAPVEVSIIFCMAMLWDKQFCFEAQSSVQCIQFFPCMNFHVHVILLKKAMYFLLLHIFEAYNACPILCSRQLIKLSGDWTLEQMDGCLGKYVTSMSINHLLSVNIALQTEKANLTANEQSRFCIIDVIQVYCLNIVISTRWWVSWPVTNISSLPTCLAAKLAGW